MGRAVLVVDEDSVRPLTELTGTVGSANPAWANPALPVWLSPVQLRVLPVRPGAATADSTLHVLRAAGIGAELDDRQRSVSWRVRDARQAWVPYVVVVGDRDRNTDTLDLRMPDGSHASVRPDRLVQMLTDEMSGYPRAGLTRTFTRERYRLAT